MGKASSMWGKTTGKVGGLVYATAGGEQIVREYSPNVSNPSTTAQVDQRAKMKLMSQLSASLASVIAMTKTGLVSKRNKFTKINFEYTYAVDGKAQVSYENLQLTEGNLSLPQIGGTMQDGKMQVFFADAPSANIRRVVWCLFTKTSEGKLEFVDSHIISERGNAGSYFAWLTDVSFGVQTSPSQDYVIYAYGMIDTNSQATTRYGNLNVETATDLATLVASRTLDYQNYQFTGTRGATWKRGENQPQYSGTAIGPNQVRVYATATNGGTVSGAGVYDIGDTVTLTATPDSGYEFVKWQVNGGGDYSTSNPVTLTASETVDLVAVFNYVGTESL